MQNSTTPDTDNRQGRHATEQTGPRAAQARYSASLSAPRPLLPPLSHGSADSQGARPLLLPLRHGSADSQGARARRRAGAAEQCRLARLSGLLHPVSNVPAVYRVPLGENKQARGTTFSASAVCRLHSVYETITTRRSNCIHTARTLQIKWLPVYKRARARQRVNKNRSTT